LPITLKEFLTKENYNDRTGKESFVTFDKELYTIVKGEDRDPEIT